MPAATTTSADCCGFTPDIAARRAALEAQGAAVSLVVGRPSAHSPGSLITRCTVRDRPRIQTPQDPQPSPNKNTNFPGTVAAFTLSIVSARLRHVVLTHPRTGPSMRFLFVDSPVCTRASFPRSLTVPQLPSASGDPFQHRKVRNSHRGLTPHQFMPMSGVHNALKPTVTPSACPRLS